MKIKLPPIRLLAVLLVSLFLTQSARPATVTWSGVDALATVNTNWSDANNWSAGLPAPTNNVVFNDQGAALAVSNINNIVDVSTNILTLKYGNTNGFHTTLINPGVTLTVSNNTAANLVWVGTAANNGPSQVVDATVTGIGGHLAVIGTNVGSTMIVQQGGASGSHIAILDLSGLDTFDLTAGRLLLGAVPGSSGNASNYLSSNLILARTNVIALNGTTAPTLILGDASVNGGQTNTLELGQTNSLFISSMTVARSKQTGTLQFNPSLAGNNPALYLRGTNAATRVATLAIGDNSAQTTTGSSSSGTVDLSLGTVDAQVNTCYVGRGLNGTGIGLATGTLSIGAGVFNVNTLFVGYVNINTAVAQVTGTVNVTNGTLVVNTNLILGYNPGATATAAATLNLSNSVVYANAITSSNGAVTSAINMTGGTLVVSNTAGTPGFPIGALNLGSATLQIAAGSTAAKVVVGSLDLVDSASVVNVSSLPALFSYPTTLPLISYASSTGGSTLNLGTLPGTYQGYISNDLASTIWLVVTNGPALTAKAVEWGGGVNNLWDTTTYNWTNAGVAVPYNEIDSVTFDDLGKTNLVNLVANHTPAAFLVTNNVLNYRFTGVGSIGGMAGLNKQGSASLTLAETGGDSFSGGIVVGGGTVILDDANCAISGGAYIANGATLQVGNNDGNGNLPAGAVTNDGSLIFMRTNNVTAASAISGTGGLTQNGGGKLMLNAANTYQGNTTVLQGTLALGVVNAVAGSAQVNVSNGTLDLSAVTGSATLSTISILTLTNASMTLGVSYLNPAVSLSSLNAGGAATTINVSALPPMTTYPVTLTLLRSASPLSGNNFVLGSLPAASPAYGGSLSESGDQTTLYLTVTNGPVAVRPQVFWSGADAVVSSNWSDALNWQEPGAPVSSDNVLFYDLGASATVSNINNIVTAHTTISSLTYGNTNNYHTTLVNPGVTLTVSNNAASNLVFVGTGTDNGANQVVDATMTGTGASLVVVDTNTGSAFNVRQGSATFGSHAAILDLSGLGTFHLTAGRLLIGGDGSGTAAFNRPQGTLILAQTNIIQLNGTTTPALNVGDGPLNGGSANSLQLGQTNSLFIDTITIGRLKSIGNSLSFNPALTGNNPALYLRGNSATRVSALAIADNSATSGTGSSSSGTVDLSLGTVDAQVDTCYVGVGQNGTGGGSSTGTLTLGAGLFNVNTLNLGYVSSASARAGVTGTVNVNAGGTLVVNTTLALGINPGATATATATLNITNGTVLANAITSSAGAVNSTINLVGGTLVVTNTAGTSEAPLTTLALDGGTLQLNVNGNGSITNIVATTVTTGATSTINIGSVANVSGTVQIPLMSYTGTDPYGALSLGTYPAGYNATLIDDTANSRIDLSLTSLVATNPTNITFSVSGNTLNLSWPADHLGWLVQSNSVNLAVPADWHDISNTAAGTNYSITIDATKANVFYRLRKP
ncbi:MAG: autotransporter-associated beta strand repeat-containing protein [Verrucomicrobiota bacterium]